MESGKLLVGDEYFANEEKKTGRSSMKTNKGKSLIGTVVHATAEIILANTSSTKGKD